MSTALLAIDTATDLASVAVGDRDTVRAALTIQGSHQHAARLLAVIDHALAMAGARLDTLTGIVVGDGPGSFTGLRIGWAAAKGLAYERGLPLGAVPSLMAAAHSAAAKLDLGPGPVAACFDALRGQVYAAMYAFRPERVETLVAPAVLTLAGLARVAPVRPRIVVGDGALRYAGDVLSWTGVQPLGPEDIPPTAQSLLTLAAFPNAARTLEDHAAEPVYGRPAEAQAKWEAHHGRPLPHPSR